jgi:hypothetical protein
MGTVCCIDSDKSIFNKSLIKLKAVRVKRRGISARQKGLRESEGVHPSSQRHLGAETQRKNLKSLIDSLRKTCIISLIQ